MKKLLVKFLSAALFAAIIFGNSIPVKAEEADLTPDFQDDFNSYGNGFIENETNFTKKWFNELIDNMLGDTESAPDSECKEVASIINDPTPGAAAGNKVMHIKNYQITGSFFYVAPRNLKVKDFELSFKVYNMRSANAPWYGISARKETNVRFNGTNNMLLTMKTTEDATLTPSNQYLAYFPLRGYGGAGAPQEKAKDLDNYDDVNNVNMAFISNYEGENHNAAKNTFNTWYTIKFTVLTSLAGGSTYKTEAITSDGITHYLGTLPYRSSSVDKHGFVSINACLADIYIDDVVLKNLDTEPAPAEETIDVTGVALNESAVELEINEEKTLTAQVSPNDADNLSVSWLSSDESVATVNNGVVKGLKAGTAVITVTTADGGFTAVCSVTVKEAAVQEPPKGCGSIFGAPVGIILMGLTAAAIISKKRI